MNTTTKTSLMSALEFRHVSLSFGDKPALRDVSFKLEPGQMMIITGAANSGKSVLLHAAIGLLRLDPGEILIEGRDIGKLSESELLAIRSSAMGIAFQEDTLFTGMSTFENAAYRLVEHNWPEERIERAVEKILHFVGLEKDGEKFPEELSIGMRRRLEIARALIGWPRIMLFDEPASGLDPINARLVMDLVIRARDLHKISVLYNTKVINEIRYLARHHASEKDYESAIRPGIEVDAPETMVMVLENGAIAFLGGISDFEASTLLAVTYMTHPESRETVGRSCAADPWSRKLRHQRH
jgi:phospholipid/cholesterol/gamma-HCH transport system ATP-binding protein